MDRLVKIDVGTEKKSEQLRSLDDFKFDFSELISISKDEKVKEVLFYTESKKIKDVFESESKKEKSKFKEIKLSEIEFDGEAKQ